MTVRSYKSIVSALKTIPADSPCHFITPNISRTAALKYQNHTVPIIRPELINHNENNSTNNDQNENKEANSSNIFTTRTDLKTAVRKVCSQLRIKINSGKSRQYKIPIFTKNTTTEEQEKELHEIPIIKQRKFRFNENNYKPTESELQSAPYTPPPRINIFTVTDTTPPATSSKQLKGLNSDLFNLAFKNRFCHQKHIYKCKFFSLNYWYTSHFMGKARKSKPGVAFMMLDLGMLNSLDLKISDPPNAMKMNYRPLKRKVEASKTRKLIKKLFFGEFQKFDMIKDRDGMYMFKVGVVAHTAEEKEMLKADIQKALMRVRSLKQDALKHTAAVDDRKLNWREVWNVCDGLGVPRIEPSTSVQEPGKKSKSPSKWKNGSKGKSNKNQKGQNNQKNTRNTRTKRSEGEPDI
ncbi:unnamed protein product [Ambrosiozyma monospora]|uniref:Unnamed protein product n=1 Tax=Ambrosiozyma monospora TaxID=43982 RepID=A0A9W7DH12_AMBMO|nr:unnamed protein product [Ambrosiozyma monospora]